VSRPRVRESRNGFPVGKPYRYGGDTATPRQIVAVLHGRLGDRAQELDELHRRLDDRVAELYAPQAAPVKRAPARCDFCGYLRRALGHRITCGGQP